MNSDLDVGAGGTKVALDLRGQRVALDREALMELPESILLCLFPNGVVLSPQRQPREDGDDDDEPEDVYYVDVRENRVESRCSAQVTARYREWCLHRACTRTWDGPSSLRCRDQRCDHL